MKKLSLLLFGVALVSLFGACGKEEVVAETEEMPEEIATEKEEISHNFFLSIDESNYVDGTYQIDPQDMEAFEVMADEMRGVYYTEDGTEIELCLLPGEESILSCGVNDILFLDQDISSVELDEDGYTITFMKQYYVDELSSEDNEVYAGMQCEVDFLKEGIYRITLSYRPMTTDENIEVIYQIRRNNEITDERIAMN